MSKSRDYYKCYFGCPLDGPLHKPPNWAYPNTERFNEWKKVMDAQTQAKGDRYISANVRLCNRHFEDCFKNDYSHLLTKNAVPTLNLEHLQPKTIKTEPNEEETDLPKHVKKEKPFACYICNYRSMHKSSLTKHMKNGHRGEMPFACDMCNHTCSDKSSLNKHIARNHRKEMAFSIQINKTTLKKYFRIPPSERKHACPICDRRFEFVHHLKRHILIHTGEKPIACELCDYRCSDKQRLSVHMITHNWEKPFACDMCSFRFSTNVRLKYHIMAVHTGEKPIPCDLCSFRCIDKQSLKHHMMTGHSAVNAAIM